MRFRGKSKLQTVKIIKSAWCKYVVLRVSRRVQQPRRKIRKNRNVLSNSVNKITGDRPTDLVQKLITNVIIVLSTAILYIQTLCVSASLSVEGFSSDFFPVPTNNRNLRLLNVWMNYFFFNFYWFWSDGRWKKTW